MSNHYSKKRRLKYVMVALACAASFTATGLAACKPEEKTEDEVTTLKEDTQLLKNGNFEFFNVPDKKEDENEPEYLINTPNNWTRGGTTSYTMSGIIGTSEKAWEKLTADNLADRLDANNALDSSASDYKEQYVDFNGMKSSDLLYKDSYGALKYDGISTATEDGATKYYIGEGDGKTEIFYDEDDKAYYYDEEMTKPVSKDLISNPLAHNIFTGDDGKPYYVDEKGEKQTIYVDDNGDYFLEYDEDKDEYKQSVGHVLMLHNYSNSNHNGIAQNYASVDVSLPANTSAEISVWVKTSDLLFSGGQFANDDQDHGANITVTHTAGSSTLDDFAITSINTEKLISGGKASDEFNGWVQYTIYVNACNFASSTVSLKLGLGETGKTVEGYAFFDDVTVTKFVDLSDENCTYSQNEDKIDQDGTRCTLTSDASEKKFVADTLERPTESGTVSNDRFSRSFHYFLDLASEDEYVPIALDGAKAGLTVDSDKYVSSLNTQSVNTEGFAGIESLINVKLPDDLKNLKTNGESGNGIDTNGDLLALVNANYKFNASHTQYYEKLNEALSSAENLPNASASDKMLVAFSSKGAAYTTSFDIELSEDNEYSIISFWVKTSDMDGNTAATVKITEKGNKTNTANVALDSTNIVTDIDDDHKDIYNGWVQCFFFIQKEDDVPTATINVEFSFGNTAISGTSVTSYKAGWAALTNMQALNVNEDVFAHTGSGSYTASLTVKKDEAKTPSVFDQVYGNQTNEIENGIVDPSSYTGTNGGSSKVVYNGFDDMYPNPNPNAGLINREHVDKYAENASDGWYGKLLSSFGVNASATDALANWNEVFGEKSVQPLIIVNALRKNYVLEKSPNEDNFSTYFIKGESGNFVQVDPEKDKFDEETEYYTVKDVLNYGFIGNEKTVSSNGYTTVSVRVKVSAGAVAYVYLVDTSDSAKVLDFKAPSYTYWYDSDGNVLKSEVDEKASLAEQRANVLYTLRADGLYEDKDGKLYANLWNYTKLYNANVTYYTKDGAFSVGDLVEGVTYYKDQACTVEADHFLVTGDETKVYEFKDGKYYYIVNGETQKNEVNAFDKSFARYDYSSLSEEYKAVIEDTHGKWVTVNFVIHAGSDSKSYRLELWSGERGELFTEGNTASGSVIFDYSYTSISSDDLLDQYETEIIKAYQTILASKGLLSGIATSTENISYYKNLVEEKLTEAELNAAIDELGLDILKNYTAHYYTYSLYDSADFLPFNEETAKENATGYDYSVSDYSESLAYLAVKETPKTASDEIYTYTVFADYSTINQDIEPDLGSDEEDEDEDEDSDSDTTNVWLLASSIILVVALIFAMIAIFVRDAMKKKRRKKAFSKNSYDANKANRYIRRLGIKKEEIEEVDAKEASDDTSEKTEEQPAEETVEEKVDKTPAEETQQPANPDGSDEPADSSDGEPDGQE